jgi:hypothetical protein
MLAVTYTIEFFNAAVQAEINGWPAGINASFTRIAEQMVESGPNLGLPYIPDLSGTVCSRFGPRVGKALAERSSAPW